jgi:hypothetical protein
MSIEGGKDDINVEAAAKYDVAIKSARSSKFVHEEGLGACCYNWNCLCWIMHSYLMLRCSFVINFKHANLQANIMNGRGV